MFKRLVEAARRLGKPTALNDLEPIWQVEESGLRFSAEIRQQDQHWMLSAYLDQLVEEDFATELSNGWLLPWEELFQLLEEEEHSSSLPLLKLPARCTLVPQLCSESSLASSDFRVFIARWREPKTGVDVRFEREGAVVSHGSRRELLPADIWHLLQTLRDFNRTQQETPGEATNQAGWAKIRRMARRAGAGMDGFLEKTVVVQPDRLKLKLRKTDLDSTPVIEVEPTFEGQPTNWLRSFDASTRVQDQYRVPGDNGSLTHVLIKPEVKTVLESVRRIPGRRVAGDDALSFVRNPFAWLGDDAERVLDVGEYEEELASAGVLFHRFRAEPVIRDEKIHAVVLELEPISSEPIDSMQQTFSASHEFAPFVRELQVKFAAQMTAGFWQGRELELADLRLEELQGLEQLLKRWQQQEAGVEFEAVLDLGQYGDRVIGIGEAEKIASPFLVKDKSEDWLPEDIVVYGLGAEALARWDPTSREGFEVFRQRVGEARAAGDEEVCLPGPETSLSLPQAERLLQAWGGKLGSNEQSGGGCRKTEEAPRAVLQIEQNIEEADYASRRTQSLCAGHVAEPLLPDLLRPEIRLREHQFRGVAWMQHLFAMSPEQVSGCLLADDMGLGKTLQLLAFMVQYLESHPDGDPVLIVAPVSLLDNWERELSRFFFSDALPVLKLYGSDMTAVKFRKDEIPADLRERGIRNLLRPGWRGAAQIVLTTYETLRDQEFSLARQHWAIVVCDEAQKIKSPAALVTQAAKAVPARFRIACTGTPVENTLIDLWCLFDFIQPGFLGGLNEFGKRFQRPIEAGSERDDQVLEALRALIEPQTLRRTKEDVAKDLPAKILDKECRNLQMSAPQRQLYLQEIAAYRKERELQERLDSRGAGVLGLLHRLKLVCAHPYAVQPDKRLYDSSPKLQWLIQVLDGIRKSGSGDKVIIFTELRDIQREVQHAVRQRFGFAPLIINGDTSTSSRNAQSRQRMIDQFQQRLGFDVIILSTVAVGFGVNVQAANHVIHFTRCWNPAKEDQATDRAYRIGQVKDVYVYYPTVRDGQIVTFEATLDDLLQRRRELARDMLSGSPDIQASDFQRILAV